MKLLENRYNLLDEPVRQGGMAYVKKAIDITTGRTVAIKFLQKGYNEAQAKNSFYREYDSLNNLKHPNIVELIDAGIDDNHNHYLVLEWIDNNLEDTCANDAKPTWEEFYALFGQKILEALQYGHARSFAHRDIKPQNILVSEECEPKIADFGISKLVDNLPRKMGTFAKFASPPFSPKEDDEGENPYSRDVYSFAATVVDCLSGGLFINDEGALPNDNELYERLFDAFEKLEIHDELRTILQNALSDDPRARQPNASNIYAQIERYINKQKLASKHSRKCRLCLGGNTSHILSKQLGFSSEKEAQNFILEEISEVCAFELNRTLEKQDEEEALNLLGVEWGFKVVPSRQANNVFEIVTARKIPSSLLERKRDNAFVHPISFSFSDYNNSPNELVMFDELYSSVIDFNANRQDSENKSSRDVFYKKLYAFLNAKNDIEKKEQDAIEYIKMSPAPDGATLECRKAVSENIVGQSRIIKTQTGQLVKCTIESIADNLIFVNVQANIEQIPNSGELIQDTYQQIQANNRQRVSLDTIFYNRAVNPKLRDILATPQISLPPIREKINASKQKLDGDKIDALEAALGVQDIIGIQGPPGTGKTRLITEIILQYLAKNPEHKILLSSQTHIALDNVIERVAEKSQQTEIIRVGSAENSKISEESKNLILEKKVHEWAKKVQAKVESSLEKFASEHKIDREQMSLMFKLEKLILLLDHMRSKTEIFHMLVDKNNALQSKYAKYLNRSGGTESTELRDEIDSNNNDLVEMKEEIKVLSNLEEDTRSELRGLKEGEALSALEFDELLEWQKEYFPHTPETEKFKELSSIIEEWVIRVGKTNDFNAAVLSSSQVIAGTCIGLASVKGIKNLSFDLCIIDEASKATITETLVPMSMSQKWILVGDPQQLPPFVEQDFTTDNSLLENYNLFIDDIKETVLGRIISYAPEDNNKLLKHQYRMVAGIGNLVSECFYDNALKSPITESQLHLRPICPKPVTWFTTSCNAHRFERRENNSYTNILEANYIADLIEKLNFLCKNQKKKAELAIIAGYQEQVSLIRRRINPKLKQWDNLSIECNTVDAFQGKQADICIYSITRSNKRGKLGFLKELPRLNVALSRAKSHLIIVGDHIFCRNAAGFNPFCDVVTYIERNVDDCEILETEETS